jgi:hypothetical protein
MDLWAASRAVFQLSPPNGMLPLGFKGEAPHFAL